MIKVITLLLTLALSTNAQANFEATKSEHQFCNHHKFTFLLRKIYDVYLCSNDQKYFFPEKIFNSEFALTINYNLNIAKDKLAKTSVKEINRYYDLTEDKEKLYYDQLIAIFPDVTKGDIIEAKHKTNGSVFFYHNNSFSGKITDSEFAKMFFNIWLHKDNKYQNMTKDLFAINE